MTEGHTFLRFLFTNYSESEYQTEAWGPISETIKRVLENSVENVKQMSYQGIYCQIYKCTCKGYKDRLFNDVKKLVTDHCSRLKSQLDECLKRTIDDVSNDHFNIYIVQFIDYLQRFRRGIEVIVPVFHYLDVIYIKPQIRSTIRQELLVIYKNVIVESHIDRIFNAFQHIMDSPECPSKEKIGLFLKLMIDIMPESAIGQCDLMKQYCNREDLSNETVSNQHDITTPASRATSKRSADDIPGEEDQPSAKRTMTTIKSPYSDN